MHVGVGLDDPAFFRTMAYHRTRLLHKFMLNDEVSTEHVGWEYLVETFERVTIRKASYENVSAEEHMPEEWKICDVKLGADHEGENNYVDDF